ncbi:MAG: alpha/beta hydrolase family protein [bacterium]|jgi:dipeptidyl aminopeptidase/acylaminoacyl peptidase|nr:prolyl oligopeptidase family serine peptidase [Betaproteobacteria bacterium]
MATMKKKPAEPREPHMQRMEDQRWLVDSTIRSVGIEWDQPRLNSYATACGQQASGDIAAVRARVQKYSDINPAFEGVARRREAVAKKAEAEGHAVTARDNYFIASVFWAASQWTLLSNDAHNLANNARKRACFDAYAKHADHRVEAAWVPLPGGGKLPGWFHLPYGYSGGKVPAIVSIPGMDGFKEANIALAGDRWLSRGIAVLVIEGPGQYEAVLGGVPFSMDAWKATGKAAYEWLKARREVDAKRVGIIGNSFGSFFATLAAAWEPRYRAAAINAICLEPAGETIFQKASPTFKHRFMYMSGFTDEARFDRMRKGMVLAPHAKRIRMPFLCVAGERDELCPVEWAYRTLDAMRGPTHLMVYQESRHSVGNVPSTVLGPNPPSMSADWMLDRLNGLPFESARLFVEANGNVVTRNQP